ncbi:MAG: DUF4440 domain-containing protein [Gemmatimonadota bacterium]|nr:MAG: DUF4440 domain-containing protein [Gemmatimonadota bacterium]
MRSNRAGPVLTGLLTVAIACAPPADQSASSADQAAAMQAAAETIDAMRANFAAAMSAGDVDAAMVNYAADAIQLPPHERAVVGKEAIRARHQMFLEQYDFTLDNPSAEIHVAGDWAIMRGNFSTTATPKGGGEPLEDSGKYLVTWRRQADGSWLAMHEMWNSDNPMPGSGM